MFVAVVCILFVGDATMAITVHNSMARVKDLVDSEFAYANLLAGVVHKARRRLVELEGKLAEFSVATSRPTKTPGVENAVDVYLLVKRLIVHQREFEHLLFGDSVRQHYELGMQQWRTHFAQATRDDLVASVGALMRLQWVYRLSARQVSGLSRELNLLPADCLRMAKVYLMHNHIARSIEWLRFAVDSVEKHATNTLKDIDMLVQVIHMRLSARVADDDVPAISDDDRGFLQRLAQKIEPVHRSRLDQWLDEDDTDGFSVRHMIGDSVPNDETYAALCRGENLIHRLISKHLTCIHYDGSAPYLLLRPLRMEVMYLDPLIVVIHDLVSTSVVDNIVDLAIQSELSPAGVNVVQEGSPHKLVGYRTASSCWLGDQHQSVASVTRLIGHVVGLDMTTSELLQVANYGVAGHYTPHLDDQRPQDLEFAEKNGLVLGRRIATFMIYGSDVAEGGATVFPLLGVTIAPRKGSGVFWYNMLESGDVDERTLHGGCPVVRGDKWVLNKWISPEGQMFRRPCEATH